MKTQDNTENKKKCDCGPECKCGCNEGKECTCGGGCKCGCKCCGGKIIALLLVFLAGMGFNELLHGCFGRCHSRGMRPAAMMSAPHKMPNFADGAGTVVIINTDGRPDVQFAPKFGGKHHHNTMKHNHKNHHGMPSKPQAPEADEIEQTPAEQ